MVFQMVSNTTEKGLEKGQTQPQYQQLKLAMDVHAASIVVARMMDGVRPVIGNQ
jgi:hypothetical protein